MKAKNKLNEYKFRKFADGWWSVIYYLSLENWGQMARPVPDKGGR